MALASPAVPPSWSELRSHGQAAFDRVEGPTNAQAQLRLFGQPESAVRVTLFRDHHAWCPYCQKIWLWLEEQRIPYRIRKVTMFCYGSKERWYKQLVPSGMLPAVELDGHVITESDRILEALERAFGPLVAGMQDPQVLPLRQLERQLFRAWCSWLCDPRLGASADDRARDQFQRQARAMEQVLAGGSGPFLLGAQLSSADLIVVPYLERMNASLAYYKGFLLRQSHPLLDRWFRALEQRSTYRGTQGDFHTHAHDLPPQMGGCYANHSPEQRHLAARIDAGPWPIVSPGEADPETSLAQNPNDSSEALARVVRHAPTLLARMQAATGLSAESLDGALRVSLAQLMNESGGLVQAPPPGTAPGLRYLRDRISVPRDMGVLAARCLRQALEATAGLDPLDPGAQGPAMALEHRRDQDPVPFLQAP